MRRLPILLALLMLAALLARSIATAQNAAGASQRVAVCDALLLVEQMLDQEPYTTARTAVEENWQQQLSLIETELQDLIARQAEAPMGSIERQEIDQQGRAAQQRYQGIRQQAQVELERLGVEQAREVYAKIDAAVQAEADAQGYGFVLMTRDGSRFGDATSVAALAQQMLARPVLVHPEGQDITAAVRQRLGLDAPAADTGNADDTAD